MSEALTTAAVDFSRVVVLGGVTDARGLAEDLLTVCATDAQSASFRLVTVELAQLSGWICSPESYLMDDEDGYERVLTSSLA